MALHAEQAALRSKRDTLTDYADDLTRPMFLVNERGRILHANQAAERLLLTSTRVRREEGTAPAHARHSAESAPEGAPGGRTYRPNDAFTDRELPIR